MAEDELNISIDKAAWPVGAMRSLSSQLRALGDTHGNLVIIALPAKGLIMIKGPRHKILGAKPDLRQLVEEYFPDADMPEELGGMPSDIAAGMKTAPGIEEQRTSPLTSQGGGIGVGITDAQPGQVKLFWKLAVQDLGPLRDMVYESQLDKVVDPHVTLLFFGGRDNEKAAEKADLPLNKFLQMSDALESRIGETVSVVANALYRHPDIFFVTVSLPPDLPCHNIQPYVKFLVRPGIPGDFARSVLQSPDASRWRCPLSQPIQLQGIVALEKGMPLPKSSQTKTHRPQRLADEAQGRWVHVRKHNSMGCAVVTFPSQAVRDNVLSWYSNERVPLNSIVLDVKPHREKQSNDTQQEVPEGLFVGWKQRGKSLPLISQHDLLQFFDQATAPWMTQAASWDNSAQVAKTLLRSKGPALPGDVVPGLEDTILLRLTRKAGSPEVASQLLTSPFLESCRARVVAAGCEVAPAWADGAKLLTPITHQQVLQAGWELEHHHVIACQSDIADINRALAVIPCRQRPKLAHERHSDFSALQADKESFFVVECTIRTASSFGPLSC